MQAKPGLSAHTNHPSTVSTPASQRQPDHHTLTTTSGLHFWNKRVGHVCTPGRLARTHDM